MYQRLPYQIIAAELNCGLNFPSPYCPHPLAVYLTLAHTNDKKSGIE